MSDFDQELSEVGFKDFSRDTKILILTNLIYAFVLPVIDIFVAAYIMRNSSDPTKVMYYQMAIYTGIPITFLINGYLLNRIDVRHLFSLGMILSGVSMLFLMSIPDLNLTGITIAGLVMGMSFGFYWSNRDYLVLASTNDRTRNFYYGLDTFFYTSTAILVPIMVGWYIEYGGGTSLDAINESYKTVTYVVFVVTIIASIVFHLGKYTKPTQTKFLFFKFHKLWNEMLKLSVLKGLAQGFIVTAPAMLIMTFFESEGTLGVAQTVGAGVAAVIILILGKYTKPKHRIYVFSLGLILFFLASLSNGLLYSKTGVILFIFFMLIARPLLDLAYFPIQLKAIDVVSRIENRNEFSYILNHEFGLFIGRFIGVGTFILFSYLFGKDFALRYALLLIATAHLLSIWVAKNLLKKQSELENNRV